jgi:hypothetical protein
MLTHPSEKTAPATRANLTATPLQPMLDSPADRRVLARETVGQPAKEQTE